MMVSVHHGWILLWISNTAWWRLREDCLSSPPFPPFLIAVMVENNNSRIEFPDKDPEEWKIVYGYMIARDMDIVKENAQMRK